MTKEGARAALAAFGLPSQPAPPKIPKSPGLPGPATPSSPISAGSMPRISTSPASPSTNLGVDAAKLAFNVGMGASTSHDGTGGPRGEPADEGRRQRSVIDRALQRNDDDYATSSMPMPGAVVSP